VLAGQKPGFLEQIVREYRSGTRKHAVMQQQAAGLSDDDVAQLAAYYAGIPGLLVK
jgi:cytochrome c553